MGYAKAKGSVLPLGQAGRRIAVLVVDDEPSILSLLVRVLESSFDVVTCASGADAVAQVPQGGFVAVISDVNMPGMTGLELLRAIREHDADLPVLLVTGQPSWEGAAAAIEYGVFRYLPKPFSPDSLSRKVREVLDTAGTAVPPPT